MGLADRKYVAEQYRDASRLDARVQLYRLYSTAVQGWLPWMFDRLSLQAGEAVLEVGCGTGNLWVENAVRVPSRVHPILSDASPPMLAAARARLRPTDLPTRLVVADAGRLSFVSRSFDVVVANHMLYHVPNRDGALSELSRVLRDGGRAVVGTNDSSHLLELRRLLDQFGVRSGFLPSNAGAEAFDLEVAREEVGSRFGRVVVHRREDTLVVTQLAPLVAYIRSVVSAEDQTTPELGALIDSLRWEIAALGAFRISVRTGLVIGSRPR